MSLHRCHGRGGHQGLPDDSLILLAGGVQQRLEQLDSEAVQVLCPAEDYHLDHLVKRPGGHTCHDMRE